MIALLNSYIEFRHGLDENEKIKAITRTNKDVRKESVMYEEKYADTIIAFVKLRKIKSDILNDDNGNPHLYSIPEVDSENEEIDTIKKEYTSYNHK